MDGARHLGRGRYLRFDDFQDEEAVLGDHAAVDDLALEIGVALLDQRRTDLGALRGGQLELRKLIDVCARAIADADNLPGNVKGRNVDRAPCYP